ncbi:MAG: SDR family NAD(P)-dependent oxidoreductase [Betaproteobacteria bacterium]|jgi:NAD(P)-dependent dehydrogenase (short-subunit alcohol dehydrogenase family)|nr:MAG: SDR family NAD(P)-dependent oxidoreductase [Betaproteobacteria bacterium]
MPDAKRYEAPQNLLAERVVLVTGASRGVGRAIAFACAKHGANVILNGRDVALLEALYDEIVANQWPEPATLPLDLGTANGREYSHAAKLIETQLGRLDGIAHCASHLERLSPLETQTIEEWQRMLRVNLIAPFAINQACARLLRQAPDASVVFTSETHASAPAAFWGGYAVSKAGLETLAQIQADEWSNHAGLRINTVVPGPVSSPLRGKTHPGEVADTLPSPDALVPLYLYLLGPNSRGVSGQIFRFQP